jgi:hypothetical protein
LKTLGNHKIDFNSRDKSRTITVLGKRHGEANIYFKGPLLKAGEQALNEAIIELRDQILMKQGLFKGSSENF